MYSIGDFLQSMKSSLFSIYITLRYRKNILKYTIDEYDHFLCFLATESEFDIRFSQSRLDLAAQEYEIFAFQ